MSRIRSRSFVDDDDQQEATFGPLPSAFDASRRQSSRLWSEGSSDDESSVTSLEPHVVFSAVDVAGRMSPHELQCFNQGIIRYLTADELKALRLVGGKALQLTDPSLTSHLQLRMDRAPFFRADNYNSFPEDRTKKWLANRRRLVIKGADAKICPSRVADLVADGSLDAASELVVNDCHAHRDVISLLTRLPHLDSLTLASHEDDDDQALLENLEYILSQVGKMKSLRHLDLEFHCTVHGSRLSFLRDMKGLESLRLRGFDLSYGGISYMREMRFLTSLHLCHGNIYNSPSDDVNEEELLQLMELPNLEHVHLEGFDSLTSVGLKPFCQSSDSVKSLVLKHCQSLSEDCLPSIGQMKQLTSLHLVHSAYDDAPVIDAEGLQHLNALSSLKSLGLFYMLDNLSDLGGLWGLTSLETLNIAVEDGIELGDLDYLCQSVLPVFVSLRKLRIFSEDGTSYTCQRENLEVEFAPFNFGDKVERMS
ncbi:hypothetical protein ACHAXT_005599 [Thalassiosira profunda]